MNKKLCGKLVNRYQSFSDIIYKIILIACKVLFIGMVFSVTYAVVGRFILRSTPKWCEETGILCMVWICFLSATMAIRDGAHIRMTILEYVFPKKVSQYLHFQSYVVLLILSVIWTIYGKQVIELTLVPKMPSTQLPMAVLFGSVFVSGVLGIIMSLSRLLKGGW